MLGDGLTLGSDEPLRSVVFLGFVGVFSFVDFDDLLCSVGLSGFGEVLAFLGVSSSSLLHAKRSVHCFSGVLRSSV